MPSRRLRDLNRSFPQLFHSEVGDECRTESCGWIAAFAEPELPGEFVSDDLRNDCARFLDELRRRVELSRELTPSSAAWPGRFQSSPNSRSAQSRQ
jgi:hypothetical protein